MTESIADYKRTLPETIALALVEGKIEAEAMGTTISVPHIIAKHTDLLESKLKIEQFKVMKMEEKFIPQEKQLAEAREEIEKLLGEIQTLEDQIDSYRGRDGRDR